MIFTKREANLIRRGKQTSLLALAKRDSYTGRYLPPRKYRPGTDIAVQPGAGLDETCRILVNGVVLATLAELDFVAARSLGFRTQAEMAAEWMFQHDQHWPLQEEAICATCDGHAVLEDGDDCPDCEFGVVQADATLPDEQTLEIFRRKHGHRPVWVVSFELPPELPRFLAAHSERGYTSRHFDALPAEQEAVDEVTQARLTKQALKRESETDAEREARKRAELRAYADWLASAAGMPATDLRVRSDIADALWRGHQREAGGKNRMSTKGKAA